MKSALILDEQSLQKLKQQGHPHISPPSLLQPQEQTLDDISPKWAMRLKNENIPTYMSLTWLRWRYELQKTSKCVVGEAYGYSSKYVEDCDECDRIGCRFLYYFSLNWRSKLERNKQEFVKHWNIVHSQYERPYSIAFNTIV
jgi:hypothetical protein